MKRQLLLILLVLLANFTEIPCHTQRKWVNKIRYDISDREVLIDTLYDDIYMVLDKKDGWVTKKLISYGTYEPINLRTFARFVKKGDIVINIGSNVGFQTVVYGKIVGPTGKLFFFEPYSLSFNILRKNVYLNQLQDISTLYKVASGSKKQMAQVLITYINTSASQIHTEQTKGTFTSKLDETEQIQVNLIDNVLPKDIKVDFALIDVERMEVQCLEGMKEVIMRSPNLIMVVEWSGTSPQLSTEDYLVRMKALVEWLYEHKFKFYRVQRDATLRSGNRCLKEKFTGMTAEETYYFSTVTLPTIKSAPYVDLIIIADHIDPNQLE